MSEEEKQPLDTSNSADDGEAVTGEIPMETSSMEMGDLSLEQDLEQQLSSLDGADEAATAATEAAPEVEILGVGLGGSVAADERAALEDLKQEVEKLKSQLEASTNQCESFKSQSMRIAADFDNFRKRTSKEKEELEQQVKRSTLTELLPVVDNFERARAAIKPKTEGEMTIQKSYQGVYKQLVECLKRLGVSPMRPEGREFDPNLHEAVMRQPTDEHPEDTVMEELVRGYYIGDLVMRHAMVKVAAAPEGGSEDTSDSASPSG